jgi:phosphopentomutase
MGLGHLTAIPGTPPDPRPIAAYGKIAEISAGKDSTTGHWEMCGLVTERAFPTYPQGFPPEIMQRFEAAIGRRTLGNRAASGTTILDQLGDEHVRTGSPIVYTSADSVFQIAAHEDVIGIEEQYRISAIARGLLHGAHNVGRVITRPFTGKSGAWVRTPHRRDFTVAPPGPSLLDVLQAAGRQVIGIGKVEDLFSGMGLTSSDHTTSNAAGMRATLAQAHAAPAGAFVFTNLNDFDTLWGHRNDPHGYAAGLQAFDVWLPEFLAALRPDDVVVVTSDHGNDPTTPSTDHSREYVPVLALRAGFSGPGPIGARRGMVDIAATFLEHQGLTPQFGGQSFLASLGNP